MRLDDISHAVCREPGSRGGGKKDLTIFAGEGVLNQCPHTQYSGRMYQVHETRDLSR